MLILKNILKFIYQLDLFCSSQLLRYNKDKEYKTLTGGIFSLGIVIVIMTGFTSMILETLNRTSISSDLTTVKQSDPPLATLTPNKENMFAFGIQIQSLDLTFIANLSQTPRYFDVQANIIQEINGVPNYTPVTLEQCAHKHWNMMPEFDKNFDVFAISSWLCVPLDMPIPIQGSYMSPISYLFQINVYPCKNQTLNDTCASQEEISDLFTTYGNFFLDVNYINPVINPNEQEYISYYIQGNDYVIFSETIASQAWFYFSDYTITSDNSIWPFADASVKTGCIVEQKAINHPYTVTANVPTVSVYLAKSENSLMYNRQVQKISAVFSYIGGLVGAITAFLFLIKIYNDSSLQITIGLSLFEQSESEKQAGQPPMEKNGFNFFVFIKLTLYRLLKLERWKGSSQYSERLEKYQDEAVQQMDVQLLLKRLIKLEFCMTRLFSHEQLEEMKEVESITVETAQKMRLLLLKPEPTDDEPNKENSVNQFKKEQSDKDRGLHSPKSEVISQMESGIGIIRKRDLIQVNQQISELSRNVEKQYRIEANQHLKSHKKTQVIKQYRKQNSLPHLLYKIFTLPAPHCKDDEEFK